MRFEYILESIKRFFSKRKRIVLALVLCLLLIAYYVLGLISGLLVHDLEDQLVADRWEYDGKVSQVSLFYTEDQMISESSIKKLLYDLEKKMRDSGIIAEDDDDEQAGSKGSKIVDTIGIGKDKKEADSSSAPEEADKVYAYCYSAQGISTLLFENRKAENISTIGVGGDFFLFHPMELVSGTYFGADDIMKDRIVIDEDLAWQLFGSNDIIGQCVTIGGTNHYIAGVVKRQEGRFAEAAGLSSSTVYMSYDSLAKHGTVLSGRITQEEISEDGVSMQVGGINCFEIVMPSPVDGLAARLVKESTGLEDKYYSVIENTARYDALSLLTVISGFGTRSMWTKPIFYPYWENVARGWEYVLGILFAIRLICIVSFWLIVVLIVINAYRNKKWTVRGAVRYLADRKYDLEARLQEKKNNSEKARLEDKKEDERGDYENEEKND